MDQLILIASELAKYRPIVPFVGLLQRDLLD